MNTKITLAKVAGCLLALGLGVSSSIGMAASNYYDHPSKGKYGNNLWTDIITWVSTRLPLDIDEQPGFRWIETTPVKTDPVSRQSKQRLNVYHINRALQRVVAPGGMFRRFEHGPAAAINGREPNGRVDAGVALGRNLALVANLPNSLFVADGDINWLVSPLHGGMQRNLYGRNLQLSLPQGSYEVSLRIGTYEERKRVDVRNGGLAIPQFAVNIGVLRASSPMPASWEVIQMRGAAPLRKLMRVDDSQQISSIVAAGEYDVVATINDAAQRTRVRVNRGATAVADLSVPTGRVNLVATLGNSPAMRPMSWKLYRLDGGRREVASPRRHSATLVVPPGHYEAIANLNGKERRREFTVMQGTDNSIVLAMD